MKIVKMPELTNKEIRLKKSIVELVETMGRIKRAGKKMYNEDLACRVMIEIGTVIRECWFMNEE
jgi:hypothetical protein